MNKPIKMKQDDVIALIDYFPGSMVLASNNGKILAINKNLANIFHKTRDQLIGTSGYDFVEKAVGELRKDEIERMIETKKPVEFIDYERGKWWKTSCVPIVDANQEVTNVSFYIQDITNEMKNEEQKLLNQEHYFLSLIENITDIITVIDKECIVQYQSPSLTKILGYSQNERIGKKLFNLIHKEDIAAVNSYINQLQSKPGLTNKIIYRVKHKNGSYRYIESIGNNQLNNFLIKGIIINSRDISDRVFTEDKLQQSELKSDAILQAIPDLMFILDEDGFFIDYNAKEQDLYESPDKFLGKNIMEVFPSEIAEKSMQCIKKSLRYRILQKIEYSIHINNEERWYEGRIVPKGKNEILIIVRDITESRIQNDQIKRTKEYLQKIIDNTIELIFTVGSDYKIKTWNETANKITGINPKQILDRDIRRFHEIENKDEISNYLNAIFKEKPALINYIMISTKYSSKRLFRVSPSIIKNKQQKITDVIFICRDVTSKEIAHSQLPSGLGYLIINESNEYINNILWGFIQDGRKGQLITRNIVKEGLENIHHDELEIVFLSDAKESTYPVIKGLDDLYNQIADFLQKDRHAFICINRVDYFLLRYDFETMMKGFYKLHDLVNQHDAILIICINKEMFTPKQFSMLKEEFDRLPSQQITEVYLDTNLYEILNYVFMENNINKIVTQMKICKYLSISKVTSQKRIKELIEKNLLTSKNAGRSKHLFITEKGKELLKNWKTN
jgi:PAS domain S-box-containing protein